MSENEQAGSNSDNAIARLDSAAAHETEGAEASGRGPDWGAFPEDDFASPLPHDDAGDLPKIDDPASGSLPDRLLGIINSAMADVLAPPTTDADEQRPGGGGWGGGLRLPRLRGGRQSRNVATATAVVSAAEIFREQSLRYQQSCKTLQSELDRCPAYHQWREGVAAHAAANTQTEQHILNVINGDPAQVGGRIQELREQLHSVLGEPSIAAVYGEVERSWHASNHAIKVVTDGLKSLHGHKGVNLGVLAKANSVIVDMAANVPDSPVTRPGSPRMGGEDSEMRKRLKDLADQIKHIVEAITNAIRTALGPTVGGSPAVN